MSSRSQLWAPEVHLYGTRKQKEKHGLHMYDRLHVRRSVLAMAKSCRKKNSTLLLIVGKQKLDFLFNLHVFISAPLFSL